MFNLQRLKNWTHSSVVDDKKELNAYQSFQDQFTLIDSKIEEYINELGSADERLFVDYNRKKVSVNLLKLMSESLLRNKDLPTEEKAYQSAELQRLYYEYLKQLKEKIIAIAVSQTDNVYLAYIHSCIEIINTLLREYSHLLAIQKSGISKVDNNGNLNAGEKIKTLKDNIEIRTAQINTRLALENLKR